MAQELDKDALLADLGVGVRVGNGSGQNDITVLRHVRSSSEKRLADDVADRLPCADFEHFQTLFEQVEREFKAGVRRALRFGRDTSVADGNYFMVGGQLAYVAELGEPIKAPDGELLRACV